MAIAKHNDRIGLTVTKEFKIKLQKLADDDGRNLSNYIVKILTDHVEQQRRAGKIPEKIEQDDSDNNSNNDKS